MNKIKKIVSMTLIAIMMVVMLDSRAFAEVKDGTYDVDFTVLKKGTSDVSMANDYFNKPGKLVVSNGQQELQLTVNHSHWITDFTVDGASEKIINEDKASDTRTSSFKLNSGLGQVDGTISVYINEKVDGKPFLYDNKYQIVYDIKDPSGASNASTDATLSSSKVDGSSQGEGSNGSNTTESVTNPQTSAGVPMYIIVTPILAILLLMITFFIQNKWNRGNA